MEHHSSALALLRKAHGAEAEFHDGQWEAIESALRPGSRTLVVQRTGWGKSVVYFLAARLHRQAGKGPTLLVSPLLALMRNQVALAARYGVAAATINSSNKDEWNDVLESIARDEIDCLLISPERLGDTGFRANVLDPLERKLGMLVIDEAHCISDWGHDFRPDYRRILLTTERISRDVPILCTTATANDRVVADIREQLGDVTVSRGPLIRKSLRLRSLRLKDQAKRLALLARIVPQMPGVGIVYTLTVADARRVAGWLKTRGIKAAAYYGDLFTDQREDLETAFNNNQIKCLVATTALGMGYDKPDVGFIIHYQRPGSIISYYQQIGRAGRSIDHADIVLIEGAEDDEINEYFIESAFPPRACFIEIMSRLRREPQTAVELRMWMNYRDSVIQKALSLLEVHGAITPVGSRWQLTQKDWRYEALGVEQIGEQRRQEAEQMREYASQEGCKMLYLARALDDQEALEPCGKCDGCTVIERPLISRREEQEAIEFMAKEIIVIKTPKYFPPGVKATGRKKIEAEVAPRDGVALTMYGNSGWGSLVVEGKYVTKKFSDELVEPSANAILKTGFKPEWVTWVPSLKESALVADFAKRLAAALGAEAVDAVRKVKRNAEQKTMQNSTTQFRNVWNSFEICEARKGRCLLIDDVVDSGWTLTAIGVKLRQAGAGEVMPFALASARPRGDA